MAFASAKLTLSCPLFAADFDPRNHGFLLVGGGGGEGRSGVGNKIALLNTSKRTEISEVVDIELSRDEDSVTSLAAARADDESVVVLAGINSSLAEQQRGNNQHLRSFKIDYPPRKDKSPSPSPGKTTPLSRTSLFRNKSAKDEKADTYQRILRLSPWRGAEAPRVASITTGLAPAGEIVFFDGTTPTPTKTDVIGRITLGGGEEAEDVDIIDLEDDGRFKVAYTNGVEVFTCEVSSKTRSNASPEVSCVYKTPLPSGKEKIRPNFRALRFVSPTSLVLLRNAPNRAGCELVLLILPATASATASGKIERRRKLRTTMKIGLGLDVCHFGENSTKERQSVIAVSGSDSSIEILTLEYSPKKGYGKLLPYTTLRDVHPFSMTKICFSTFTPPAHPVTSDVRPQSIKLASVSMGNTVVVHTIPLSPFPAQSRTPRYVLARPGRSDTLETAYSGFAALLIVAIACFLLQAFTEIRGGVPPYLGATEWLSPRLRDMIARPYMFDQGLPTKHLLPSDIPSVEVPHRSLRDLLRARRANQQGDNTKDVAPGSDADVPSVIVRCDGADIVVETANSASPRVKSERTRAWEQLAEEERQVWKQRLIDAGHWALEEGETILQGVLFGEFCGLIGNAVREGLP